MWQCQWSKVLTNHLMKYLKTYLKSQLLEIKGFQSCEKPCSAIFCLSPEIDINTPLCFK